VGESWESSNLYWARLADEMGYAPVTLNLLIPELSRHMIAKNIPPRISRTGRLFCGRWSRPEMSSDAAVSILSAASTIAQH